MLKKLALATLGTALLVGAGVYAAFQLNPWPSVWVIRHVFAKGAKEASASAAPYVPLGISKHEGLSYAPDVRDALFDVFAPANARAPLPAIIWVHGGGFVAGSRSDLSNYLQVLASRGFVTVAIDYTRAPTAQAPTPVRQTNAALIHIIANAGHFNIDPKRIFLAGDSAGAQIAAQAALVISDPRYARRIGIQPGLPRQSLRGVVLFCGPYDAGTLSFDGEFGSFMRTVLWSYLGTRDPGDPRMSQMSVTPHVTASYPPAFISVGNADPLAPQSVALAEGLRAKGVEVDTLFFPADRQPPLNHEYQLLLSTDAGRLSFNRATAFLQAHSSR